MFHQFLVRLANCNLILHYNSLVASVDQNYIKYYILCDRTVMKSEKNLNTYKKAAEKNGIRLMFGCSDSVQSNLSITTTWGTTFLWLFQTGGCYKEDLCITAKTVNSDIWSLYKGSIIFHLITHDMTGFLEKEKTKKFLNNIR